MPLTRANTEIGMTGGPLYVRAASGATAARGTWLFRNHSNSEHPAQLRVCRSVRADVTPELVRVRLP